jgi:hypothetical protein
MSTFEKRQKALADQIAQYEQEAVGPKDWTLLGEASSRARPENSLLEEDLDFEHVRKMTPTITEESVKSLEDLIKKRILDVSLSSISHDDTLTGRTTSTRQSVSGLMNLRLSSLLDISSFRINNLRNPLQRSTKKSTKLLLRVVKLLTRGTPSSRRIIRRLRIFGMISVTSLTP